MIPFPHHDSNRLEVKEQIAAAGLKGKTRHTCPQMPMTAPPNVLTGDVKTHISANPSLPLVPCLCQKAPLFSRPPSIFCPGFSQSVSQACSALASPPCLDNLFSFSLTPRHANLTSLLHPLC